MTWVKRSLVALPFVIALTLNILLFAAVRPHWYREHIYGYGFLFATPWAWLLERIPIGNVRNGRLGAAVGYAVILWIPGRLLLAQRTVAAARRAKQF